MPHYTPVIGLLLILVVLGVFALIALGIQTLMLDHRPRRPTPGTDWTEWAAATMASWAEADDAGPALGSLPQLGVRSPSARASAWDMDVGRSSSFDDSTVWRLDDETSRHAGLSIWEADEINPASGLSMIGGIGGIDVGGNSYGFSDSDIGCSGSMGGGMDMHRGMGCGHDAMGWD